MSKKAEQVSNENNVKVVTKKKGGCGFFAGFFSCILLTVLVIGGFGFYVYSAVTINQIESVLGVKLPIEGDIRNKPVKDLITLALETKDGYVHMTINDLPEKLGVDLPETIPGTDISLTPIYDSNITFLDKNITVRNAEIMDIANNTNAFIDAVLPVFYDNVKVGELLSTLDLDTTLNDMGYPAFTEALYNVGTASTPSYKTLNELTITQAKDVLVDYYGADNLTIQGIIDAVGLQEFIPDPVVGETDIYAGLRGIVVAQITSDDLLGNITGAILAEHIDLSEYKFAGRDAFLEASILDMPDYIQTVPLSDFIEVPESTNECTNPTLRLMYALRNATLDTFMAEDVIAEITALIDSENGWQNLTLGTLLNKDTLGDIEALCNVKFTDLISDSENTIDTLLKTLTLGDLVTINSITSDDFFTNNPEFAEIDGVRYTRIKSKVFDLQVNQILTLDQISSAGISQDNQNRTLYELMAFDYEVNGSDTRTLKDIIPETILQEIGGFIYELRDSTHLSIVSDYNALTIQEVVGAENELSKIVEITDITLDELLNNPDALNTIMDEFGTLGEMCDSNTGIFAIIGDIAISDLLNDPDIVMDTIKSSTKTLADLLEISSPTGIVAEIATISVGDLFTNANDAINNKLKSSTTTLATLLGISNPEGIISIISSVTVGELFTDAGTAITNALENSTMKLSELLNITDTTGFMGILADITVGGLFSDASTTINSALEDSTMTLASLIGLTSSTGMVGSITTTITVGDLFGDDPSKALNDAINAVKLSDFFTDVDENNTVLNALLTKNPTATVADIDTAISGLTIADILGCYSTGTFVAPTSGVFALFTQTQLNTTINNLNDLDIDLANTTIKKLIEVGMLTGTFWENSAFATDDTLADVTITEILEYAITYNCNQNQDEYVDDGYTGILLTDFIASRTATP